MSRFFGIPLWFWLLLIVIAATAVWGWLDRFYWRKRVYKAEEALDTVRNEILFDPELGILNKNGFTQALVNRVAEFQRDRLDLERDPKPFTLWIIDFNRFKSLNDTHGHRECDLLVQEVVRRIRTELREADIMGRLGGDEFSLILLDSGDRKDIADMAERLIEIIEEPINLEIDDIHGKPMNNMVVNVSIGILMVPEEIAEYHFSESASDLADKFKSWADRAMYFAKVKTRELAAIGQYVSRFRFSDIPSSISWLRRQSEVTDDDDQD